MSRLFYNRNHTFNTLFWFFQNYFQDASLPTAENLFLLAISMLALDFFRSIRFHRSAKGIERLSNLTCISYAAVRLLPYYSREFGNY